MREESRINRTFRSYGEDKFGKEAMDRITIEQVDEARVYTMNVLEYLTMKYGCQAKGTAREIFCEYISRYM